MSAASTKKAALYIYIFVSSYLELELRPSSEKEEGDIRYHARKYPISSSCSSIERPRLVGELGERRSFTFTYSKRWTRGAFPVLPKLRGGGGKEGKKLHGGVEHFSLARERRSFHDDRRAPIVAPALFSGNRASAALVYVGR